MSYHANLDSNPSVGGDVATTSGWGDFIRWTDGLDEASEVKHLATYGWSQELPDLRSQLESSIKSNRPSADVLDIARVILGYIKKAKGAEVIDVTDGAGEAEP